MAQKKMTVAVTGVTGTIGHGLLPFLEADARVARVIGVARRPWSPERDGSRKLEYRQADVRDRYTVRRALEGADVVVHLAFNLSGLRESGQALDRINVEGSRNVLAAAEAVGARRFVYTSSAAVYGFGEPRAVRVDEDTPVADGERHFYSRHKRAVEDALLADLERMPAMEWIFFRPCAVVGPHAGGGAAHALPPALGGLARSLATIAASAGARPPVPPPPVPLQFVHERDVGQAIHLALTSDATRAIYNLGGEGLVEPADVPRLVGLHTLPIPLSAMRGAVAAAARLPRVRPALGWIDLLRRPLEVDTALARSALRWRPEFTSAEALASTRRALAI